MPDKMLVDSLVNDLLAADPTLREKEPALRRSIEKLLASRPDVPHDEKFIAALRADLMKEFSAQRAAPAKEGVSAVLAKPWFLLPAGVLAAMLAIAVVTVPGLKPAQENRVPVVFEAAPQEGVRVSAVGERGFGDLLSLASGEQAIPPTRGLGGGGGSNNVAAMDAKMEAGTPGASMIMPVPEQPYAFTYVYTGDPLVLAEAKLPVLRRVKGASSTGSADAVRGLLPKLADFSRLDNLKLQSVSAYEDKEYGMSVYADLWDESVSLSQYYARWPHPEQACRDQACYEALRVRETDLPTDSEAIAAADAFLASYGISKDGYGSAEVRTDWRRWYDAMPVKSDYWFPEAISVVYPMMANGTKVVDEGGSAYGLTVNVNVRADRADGAWNLYTRNYESADYDAETDPAAILAVAKRGGVYGWVPEEGSGTRVIEVRLGTPTRVLMRTWQYGSDSLGRELLVPALRFPVLDATTEVGVTQEAIVIPLVKEMLTRTDGGGGGGGPGIMLKTEPATQPPTIDPAATPAPKPAY